MAARVPHAAVDPGPGRPVSDLGPGEPDPDLVDEETPAISPAFARGTCDMRATDHIVEFIAWTITDDDANTHEVRQTKNQVLASYRYWAQRRSILPLPEKTLLTLLGKHPQIERKRDRRKDGKGRVVRVNTEARSPARDKIYIFSPPRAEPVLPGKPPVAELVEARPILTKQQRQAQRAALEAPEQLDLPMRRVA